MKMMSLPLTSEYFDDLMVRMAHHSTAIEGNTLTLGETKSVLIDGYIPRPMEMRELNEVLNYKNFTRHLIDFLREKRPVNKDLIQEFHILLCNDAIQSVPGQFKQVPNVILGADFIPTPPYRVPMNLEDWRLDLEMQLQYAKDNYDVVETICRQHVRFEYIHPFPDGNGRVGRALMVYTCLLYGVVPPVIPVTERNRYINYMNNDDINGLTNFCEKLQEQEKLRIDAFAESGCVPIDM